MACILSWILLLVFFYMYALSCATCNGRLQDKLHLAQSRNTLGNMSLHREAGTSPCLCTHRTYVAGEVDKLMHTKQIETEKCVVAGTVCKSSAHDATLKLEIILFLLQDARTQTSRISCNIFRGQNVVPVTEIFRKNRHVKRGTLPLQHVLTPCP